MYEIGDINSQLVAERDSKFDRTFSIELSKLVISGASDRVLGWQFAIITSTDSRLQYKILHYSDCELPAQTSVRYTLKDQFQSLIEKLLSNFESLSDTN